MNEDLTDRLDAAEAGGEAHPAEALGPGACFRGMYVQGELGRGSMGVAWLVSHPILRRPFVLKTFIGPRPPELFREAHLAARVTSPHVVPVLDAGAEGSCSFMLQSYVDGIDLGELLGAFRRMKRRLPTRVVCRVTRDAARGLQAIHQAGVVHRDVKPANLFLRGSGEATVGDFGIALPVDDPGDAEEVVGTPAFMAPEIWAGGPVDRRADLYGLGATAHQLATGKRPFEGRTLVEMACAHREQPYEMPEAGSPREAYLYSLIARTMAKVPQDRYETAEALIRDLSVIVEPLPELVREGPDLARIGSVEVRLGLGDLAAARADVIVNAANHELTMELGVARALRAAAGRQIEVEAMSHAPAAMGEVVWTSPGSLSCGSVAHAVSAMQGAICLQRCALRVLLGAEYRGARSVAFPALGTGVGEVPMELAAKLLLEAVRTFAWLEPEKVAEVRWVLFDDAALQRWRSILRSM